MYKNVNCVNGSGSVSTEKSGFSFVCLLTGLWYNNAKLYSNCKQKPHITMLSHMGKFAATDFTSVSPKGVGGGGGEIHSQTAVVRRAV